MEPVERRPGSGLFKSTDGGDHWTEITRNPGLPQGIIGKIGVAVSGADANRVYAIVENENGGVFVSDDAGATWKLVSEDRSLRQRAFYYSRIYADPKAKDTVYVLNVGFYRSTDGGKTYRSLRHAARRQPRSVDRPGQSAAHGREQRRRRQRLASTAARRGPARNMPTAQLYHVATTRDIPYHVCGAQQDSTTICVSSAGAAGRGGRRRRGAPYARGRRRERLHRAAIRPTPTSSTRAARARC